MNRFGDNNEAFHASIISSYVSYCGLATKFQYIHGEVPSFRNVRMINGTALHTALELIHDQELWDAADIDLQKLFIDCLRVAEFEHDDHEVPVWWDEDKEAQKSILINDATIMLRNYIRQPDNRNCKIILSEAPFKLSIGDGTQYKFEGRIDQLREYPDGTLELLDFKSGARVPGNDEMRRMYQFAIYALAVRDGKFEKDGEWINIGRLPDTLTWYHLKDHMEYLKPTPVAPIEERNGKYTDSYFKWFNKQAITHSLDEIKEITGNNRLRALDKVYFNTGHEKGPGRHTVKLTEHRINVMRKSIIWACAAMRMNVYMPNPSACTGCRFVDTCDMYLDGTDKKFVEQDEFLPSEAYQLN